MEKLSNNIINKIFLFLSHPVADIVKIEIDKFNRNYYDSDNDSETESFLGSLNNISEFSDYYFTKYRYINVCDSCAFVHKFCKCISIYYCCRDYKNCALKCGIISL